MNISGKTALVTGGGSGLGLAITKKLIEKNCQVYICGRNTLTLELAKKEIGSSSLRTFACDLTMYPDVEKLAAEIGRTDILINNAGVWLEGNLETCTPEQITQAIDINLKGVIYTTHAVLPAMKQQNEGFIINISSTSGLAGRDGQTVYCAAKFGVQGFTESLKLELISTNIKVAGFYPGGMNTKLFEKAGTPKDNQDWMDTNKVASIITFMLEQDESMIIDHLVVNKRGTKSTNK